MKEKKFFYSYPRASITVDALILDSKSRTKLLLIKRGNDPFKNCWALPGGFIEMEENLIDSVKRELLEETSLKDIELYQFRTYGDIGRDPRGRTVTIVYYGFCENIEKAQAGDDAKELSFFDIDKLPSLAFDHSKIINDFLSYIQNHE